MSNSIVNSRLLGSFQLAKLSAVLLGPATLLALTQSPKSQDVAPSASARPDFVGVLDFAGGEGTKYVEGLRRQVREAAAKYVAQHGGSSNFQIASRWPGNISDPIQLTWSLVPDGTKIIDQFGNPASSNLFARMDTLFGAGNWLTIFSDVFDRYDQLSGIDFKQVVVANDADDQADWGSDGVPGLRGDIRIGMTWLDGPLTAVSGFLLGFAQEPHLPSPGDIVLDSAEAWNLPNWTTPPGYATSNVIAHEIGHAIGLDHVCPTTDATKVMEPFTSPFMNYWGPQHDDERGAHALYGDPNEVNDTRHTATQLFLPPFGFYVNYGAINEPNGPFGPVAPASGLFSIDQPDDVDYYTFTINSPTLLYMMVSPVGMSYGSYPETCGGAFLCCSGPVNEHSHVIEDLRVELLDRNLNVLINQTTQSGVPVNFQINLNYIGVPYYVRVTPLSNAPGAFPSPQCYDIEVEPLEGEGCDPNQPVESCTDGFEWNGIEVCASTGDGCYVSPLAADCNANWIEDAYDIASGASQDCDSNGIPDECETDCNGNGIADRCDIHSGTSVDCDANGIPDECEEDCNLNGFGDACDILAGTSVDLNHNGVPDECESTLMIPSQYASIADALAAANNGDTILLASGIYTGPGFRNLSIVDKTVQIVAEKGALTTIVDLQGLGRAAYIASVNKPNRTTIRGIWFRNGNGSLPLVPVEYNRGGAIFIESAQVTIDRCIFSGNAAAQEGGAVSIQGSSQSPFAWTEITSTLFYGNSAGFGGAVSLTGETFPNLINCTFVANTAATDAGAIYAPDTLSGGGVISCIVWNNVPATNQIIDEQSGYGMVVKYCDLPADVLANYPLQPGNINVNPLFVNPGVSDYHIRRLSPCVNAGDPSTSAGPTDLDYDGQPRINSGLVDIGADEYR